MSVTEAVEAAIAATVEQLGKIDIVVNGAAGNFLCNAEELSPNGFGAVVDIDLKGTFNVCRAAFEQLKEHRGQILNISATLHYLGTPMQLHVLRGESRRRCADTQSRGRVGTLWDTRKRHRAWANRRHRRNDAARAGADQGAAAQGVPLGRFGQNCGYREGGAVYLFGRGELY